MNSYGMSDYFLILQAKVLFYFFELRTLSTHFQNTSLKMQSVKCFL